MATTEACPRPPPQVGTQLSASRELDPIPQAGGPSLEAEEMLLWLHAAPEIWLEILGNRFTIPAI